MNLFRITKSYHRINRHSLRTDHEVTVEIESSEALIGRLGYSDRRLLIDTEQRQFTVAFDVNSVPGAVVKGVGSHLLKGLYPVADVKSGAGGDR